MERFCNYPKFWYYGQPQETALCLDWMTGHRYQMIRFYNMLRKGDAEIKNKELVVAPHSG